MALKKSKKVSGSLPESIPPPCPLYGWKSIEDVASEISHSIHSDLLCGEFVFAARGDWELQRIVVTRRIDNPDLYMIGVICKGWTMYAPGYPKEAILDFVKNDMKEKKVPQGIINDFEKILNDASYRIGN